MTTIDTGVPFGAHTAWLSCSSRGEPPERTRVAPTVQVADREEGQSAAAHQALKLVKSPPSE